MLGGIVLRCPNILERTHGLRHLAASRCASESLMVLAEDLGVVETGAQADQEAPMQVTARPRQTIMDPQPLLPPHDHPGLSQVSQVSRDGRLWQRQRLMKMTNA